MKLKTLTAMSFAICLSTGASAALYQYDGFDYAEGAALSGLNDGGGWGGPWRDSTAHPESSTAGTAVATPGLTYTDSGAQPLPTTGNHVTLVGSGTNISSQAYRNLSASHGSSSGEIWISFIGETSGVGYIAFYGGSDANSVRRFFIGAGQSTGNNWGASAQNTATARQSAIPGSSQSFLLVRLNYGTSSQLTALDLWVNPPIDDLSSLGAPDAAYGAADLPTGNYSFDRIRLFGSHGAVTRFDEFRIGSSFSAVTAESDVTAPPPPEEPEPPTDLGSLELLSTERLGTRLYNQRRSFLSHEGTLIYTTVTDLVFGAGQGDNLMLWKRPEGQELWQSTLIRPERKTTMISIAPLDNYPGESLISYVDRQNDHISISQRVVYLERLKDNGTSIKEILSYSDGGSGVLNPVLVPYPEKDLAYWFIPDRTTPWRVRWFRVNLADDTWVRLDDIPMPASGARMFGYHRDGNRAVMPVGMLAKLYVLDVDLDTETYTLKQIDEANSPDGQPCREVDIHYYSDLDLYLLTYLRPTGFSNRPVTGLLGEFVATTLAADTLTPLHKTVIGGYTAEKAATHHVSSQQACPRSFVSAYTTVDKVNQWHLTGDFANLVATHLDRWEVLSDGSVLQRTTNEMEPHFRHDLVMDQSTGILHFMLAETKDVFPLLLMNWKVEPLETEPPEEPAPLQSWLIENYGETALDDDIDVTSETESGLPILLHYAFNIDLSTPNHHHLPQLDNFAADGRLYPSLILREPENRSDIHYSLELSLDLNHWEALVRNVDYTLESISPDSDGTPRKQAVLSVPVDEWEQSFFLRVRVSLA